MDDLKYEYPVSVKSNTSILYIRNSKEIDFFHSLFAMRSEGFYPYRINWRTVAEQYQGIVINPYLWERRLDGPVSDWYYGWDCASGCFWDLSSIQIKQRGTENNKEVEK